MSSIERRLLQVHSRLRSCRACPNVCGEAVHGPALETPIMLIGQAPGVHEGRLGRPFAFTAGKTLFKWLHEATGADEENLREIVYFSAITRCFPGKPKNGAGDRVPSREEIANCRVHLSEEIRALQPKLILAVGRLAIEQVLGESLFAKNTSLTEVIGRKFKVKIYGQEVDVIPLPHPSGVSRWPKIEPGKTCLAKALKLVRREFSKLA
jgi:uracil-DNA glycosylase